MLSVIKFIHQALFFLLELAMLVTLGYWGFHSNKTSLASYAAGIGLPLLAAILWGILAAPKSARRLALPYRILFSLILFGISSFLLFSMGYRSLGVAFGIATLGSQLLTIVVEKQ